jgi:hypothetical protein
MHEYIAQALAQERMADMRREADARRQARQARQVRQARARRSAVPGPLLQPQSGSTSGRALRAWFRLRTGRRVVVEEG